MHEQASIIIVCIGEILARWWKPFGQCRRDLNRFAAVVKRKRRYCTACIGPCKRSERFSANYVPQINALNQSIKTDLAPCVASESEERDGGD